jgi:hypothetical protein
MGLETRFRVEAKPTGPGLSDVVVKDIAFSRDEAGRVKPLLLQSRTVPMGRRRGMKMESKPWFGAFGRASSGLLFSKVDTESQPLWMM